MTMHYIPIAPGVPHQVQTTTLDGRPFTIRLDWIQRIARWAISIDGIVTCKGLARGADILAQVRSNPAAPQGALLVIGDEEPTLDTLGGSVRLVYVGA